MPSKKHYFNFFLVFKKVFEMENFDPAIFARLTLYQILWGGEGLPRDWSA